ncbi:MAG: diaminopimelate decarboxylase [Theionarchaea archaeon]|nr:diaminopimelate decarboxylase [Theionarchaea archaeon]
MSEEIVIDEARLNTFVPEPGYIEVNQKGHLQFDGVDCVDLRDQYGSPLYVMSERRIRENYRSLVKAFTALYKRAKIAYAYKANPVLAALRILNEEGATAEVISTGELFLARVVGVKGDNIVLNGCYKDRRGIRLAIKMGAIINVDSFHELDMVDEEASRVGIPARIGIRINPIVRTGTLSVWETALDESKFGIRLEKGMEAYKKAKTLKNVEIVGIHTHIGSQIENTDPYRVASTRIMDFVGDLKEKLGIDLEMIDLGGGIAVPFKYIDRAPLEEYAHAILDPFIQKKEEYGLRECDVVIEPGGSIIGTSTILLVTVGIVKREESGKKWALVDGGANINLRATQGWYVYQSVCCNKMKDAEKEVVNVAGPLCYAGDVLGYNRELPYLGEGDVLAFLDCGAYTMAILNRYNSYPFPAAVLIKDGVPRVIKRREALTDLFMGEELI